MANTEHRYSSTVSWDGELRGRASADERTIIDVGAPSDFGGSDTVWSPEHLAVAAVNVCMMLSFITVAAASKLSFSGYTSEATGTLGKIEGRGTAITSVHVRPRITIPATTERARLDRVLQLTKKNCFISNSLISSVTLDAEVVVA